MAFRTERPKSRTIKSRRCEVNAVNETDESLIRQAEKKRKRCTGLKEQYIERLF